MATRQQVQSRKAALQQALRSRAHSGELRPGTLAPSKRQLASEFGVSATVVGEVMRELVAEQLFHTVPRSGTYVGALRPVVRERFLFLADSNATATPLRNGFDDRIAALGGAVLTMFPDQVEACRRAGVFPNVSGAWEWGARIGPDEWKQLCGQVPNLACYATLLSEAEGRDSVSFDDFDGGRQATEHLLHLGHRAIGFLGLHQQQMSVEESLDEPAWSRLREMGWRTALETAGVRDDGCVYASQQTGSVSHPGQIEAARAGARELIARVRARELDAVIAANDRAAQALLEELRESGLSPARWPAIVSFDNDADLQSEALTSLRLPWDEIGHAAAELLWKRSHGELPPEPQHTLVKMRLIPRLTCQPNWMGDSFDVALMDQLVMAAPAR